MHAKADQSEHQFLTFCAKIHQDPQTWEMLHIGLSHDLDRRHITNNISGSDAYLQTKRQAALNTFEDLNKRAKDAKTEAVSYIFMDNDIVLFAKMKNRDVLERFRKIQADIAHTLPPSIPIESLPVAGNIKKLHKLAEQKMTSARFIRAMQQLSATDSKRETVKIRRQNRSVPLVMLIEDDHFTAALTSQVLAPEYDVLHLHSGEEAIEYYLDYAPDVILIDLHLPGISGNDTLQIINTIDPLSYCVVTSADTTEATVIQAAKNGANCYLRKPYRKERLLWSVRQSPHLQAARVANRPPKID